MIVETADPVDGSVRAINTPIVFSGAERGATTGPPLAGQQTRQILHELGRTDAEIDGLLDDGVTFEQTIPE